MKTKLQRSLAAAALATAVITASIAVPAMTSPAQAASAYEQAQKAAQSEGWRSHIYDGTR